MGPHDDDGSGVTLAVALRATPVVPATAAATAAATPSANSENFLFNASSSIVRPECVLPREEPYLPSDLRWGSISRPGPGFKMGRSCFRAGPDRLRGRPTMRDARGGGAIGRRDGLKSHCPSGRVGSSPTRRIKPSITPARSPPSGYDWGGMA